MNRKALPGMFLFCFFVTNVSFSAGISELTHQNGGLGAWVAQSVKHPTLGLGSGQDLRVVKSSGDLSTEPAGDSFPLHVPPPLLVLSLSLS